MLAPLRSIRYLRVMSATVTRILEEIERLSESDRLELREAIAAQWDITRVPAMHDADLKLVAESWEKLGPAPEVDYDSL